MFREVIDLMNRAGCHPGGSFGRQRCHADRRRAGGADRRPLAVCEYGQRFVPRRSWFAPAGRRRLDAEYAPPIVEAAGYLVIGEKDELTPDITIVSQDREVPDGEGGRVLRLATDPDAADGQDSIYRYDRAGLLIALKSASAGRR
jgi:hypothetical protein